MALSCARLYVLALILFSQAIGATVIASLQYTDLSVRVSGLSSATNYTLGATTQSAFPGSDPFTSTIEKGRGFAFATATYDPMSITQEASGDFVFKPGDSSQFLFAGYSQPLDPKLDDSTAAASIYSSRGIRFSGLTLSQSTDVGIDLSGFMHSVSSIDPTAATHAETILQYGYLSYYVSQGFDSFGATFGGLCTSPSIWTCGPLGDVSRQLQESRNFSLSAGTWDLTIWFDRWQTIRTTNMPEPPLAPLFAAALIVVLLPNLRRQVTRRPNTYRAD